MGARKNERAPGNTNRQTSNESGGDMNKDNVKGSMDDAAGRAKRQVGEWTGDTKTQTDGATQQVKGKVEKAWGNVKDAAHDMNKGNRSDDRTDDTERP
jgi:uncharacterized protein YjbJ (UPF0337 family)